MLHVKEEEDSSSSEEDSSSSEEDSSSSSEDSSSSSEDSSSSEEDSSPGCQGWRTNIIRPPVGGERPSKQEDEQLRKVHFTSVPLSSSALAP